MNLTYRILPMLNPGDPDSMLDVPVAYPVRDEDNDDLWREFHDDGMHRIRKMYSIISGRRRPALTEEAVTTFVEEACARYLHPGVPAHLLVLLRPSRDDKGLWHVSLVRGSTAFERTDTDTPLTPWEEALPPPWMD